MSLPNPGVPEDEFALVAKLLGFNLDAIDEWIALLPDSPRREELRWRRDEAMKADVNSGAMLAALDGLVARLRQDRDRDAALAGRRLAKRQSNGGNKTAALLKRCAAKREQHLTKAANDILKTDPHIARKELALVLADRGHGGAEAIRKMLPYLLGKKSREEK